MGGGGANLSWSSLAILVFYIFLDEFLNTVSYEGVLYVMGARII